MRLWEVGRHHMPAPAFPTPPLPTWPSAAALARLPLGGWQHCLLWGLHAGLALAAHQARLPSRAATRRWPTGALPLEQLHAAGACQCRRAAVLAVQLLLCCGVACLACSRLLLVRGALAKERVEGQAIWHGAGGRPAVLRRSAAVLLLAPAL